MPVQWRPGASPEGPALAGSGSERDATTVILIPGAASRFRVAPSPQAKALLLPPRSPRSRRHPADAALPKASEAGGGVVARSPQTAGKPVTSPRACNAVILFNANWN